MIKDKSDIEKEVFQAIDKLGPYEDSPEIAVAVSGGVDSMVMTDIINKWSNQKKGKIFCITIDHKLRKESTSEAAKINKILTSRDISHEIIQWNYELKPKSNIQSQAREARYDMLVKWCRDNNILHLFIAHHSYDQAETFYMRLKRGSGIDGLSSMSKISNRNGVRILRPMLDISKNKIIDFAIENKIDWIEDSSNQNENFERVKVRNQFGSDERFILRLSNAAKNLFRVKFSLEFNITKALVDSVKVYPEKYIIINLKKYIDLNPEEALTILSRSIFLIGENKYKVRFNSLEFLYNKILNLENFTITLGNCKITQNSKKYIIKLTKESRNISPNKGKKIIQNNMSDSNRSVSKTYFF